MDDHWHESGEEIIIRYEGLRADSGEIDLGEVAESLQGWHDLLGVVIASMIQGRPITPSTLRGAQIDLRLRAVRPGSIDFVVVAMVSGILGGVAWDSTKGFSRSGWRWLRIWFRDYLEAKRSGRDEEDLLRRHIWAGQYSLPDGEVVPDDGVKAIATADRSLVQIASPIEDDASAVSLIVPRIPRQIISIGAEEKRLILRPFGVARDDIPTGHYEVNQIRLVGINTRNGWGRFVFVDAEHPGYGRQHDCKVVDESLKEPHSIYTSALDDQRAIRVWMQQVIRSSDSHSTYWLIYGNAKPHAQVEWAKHL